MEPSIAAAAALIRARLAEINEERQQLERSLSALTGASPATARTRKSSRRASANGRRKVAPRGQRRKQLLAHLKKNPGARPVEIAKAIGTTSGNVHNLLRKAREDRLVKKQGNGYGLTAAGRAGSELAAKTNR
jgi:winged helix-turn-helix DNA-binding protein